MSEELCHQALEYAWAVREPHWHTHPLVVAERRSEGRLVHTRFIDAELPEAREEVDLGEDCRVAKVVEQVFRQRNWELVLDGLLVESTEVKAEAQPTVLLGGKEDGGTVGAGAGADDASVQHLYQLGLELHDLGRREAVDSLEDRKSSRGLVDLKVFWSLGSKFELRQVREDVGSKRREDRLEPSLQGRAVGIEHVGNLVKLPQRRAGCSLAVQVGRGLGRVGL
eukprot:456380-Rhodomonas_salina.2